MLQTRVPMLQDADEQETISLPVRLSIDLQGLVSIAEEVDKEVMILLRQY